jgi:hypothetical protein
VAGAQPHVEFDPGVDLAAAKAAPATADQRYRTKGRTGNAVLGGNHHRQRAEIGNDRRKHGRRNIPVFETQQCDVGCVIAARDAGRPRRSGGKLHRNLAFVGQGLVGRHDQAGFPDEPRGLRTV